jgi:TonB family protein
MNAALIYRSNGRWLVWVAFACAAGIHLTAIALAETNSQMVSPDLSNDRGEVIGIDTAPPNPPSQTEEFSPLEAVPTATEEEPFPEEAPHSQPVHPRKHPTVPRAVRPVASSGRSASPTRLGSLRALVIYGPRPEYPYEARRMRITGSGVALVTIDPATGTVTDVRMRRSTGSAILDDMTIQTFRRWRFKPIEARTVEVPITYTLTGASY